MDRARVVYIGGLHSGIDQAIGIGAAFVAQRIVAGRQHEGRRQVGEVAREQRREAQVAKIGRRRHVGLPEPVDEVPGEEIPLGELAPRATLLARVGGGIDQHLEGGRLLAGVAAGLADDCCDGSARRIAADRKARRVCAEGRRVVADMAEGRDAVVDRRGEGMFRRQAIIDGDHQAAALVGEPATGRIVGIEVADHEAAAVIVDQRRQRTGGGAERTVAAEADLATRPSEGAVGDRADFGRRRFAVLGHLVDGLSPHRVGQRMERRSALLRGLVHQIEQGTGLGVEHLVHSAVSRTGGDRRRAPVRRQYG